MGFMNLFKKEQEKQEVKQEENKEITRSDSMEKVYKCGIKKEAGYLYFVDKQGDVSRAKMQHNGRKKAE